MMICRVLAIAMFGGAVCAVSSMAIPSTPALGQTVGRPDTLNLQADSITYEVNGRVILRSNVELFYRLLVLTADEVRFDQRSQSLIAAGNVIVRHANGTRSYADHYQLPPDVRDAFARALRTTNSSGADLLKIPRREP